MTDLAPQAGAPRRLLDIARLPAWAPAAVVAALAVLVSLSGLGNGFTYDDIPIIRENERVHDLLGAWRLFGQPYWPPPWTGEVYRPLTLLLFAIQWTLGGGSPLLFHLVSILLYAALGVAVHRLATLVLPDAPRAALAAGVLFAVHPVHVEAVANIVGQSELLVGLLCTVAVVLYVRWRRHAPDEPLGVRRSAILAALFLAACLSKEHGIVLPALLAIAEWLLVRPSVRRGGTGLGLGALVAPAIALALVGGAYLAVRTAVVGGLGGATSVAFLDRSPEARLLTALGAVPHWVRLLLWPAELSADYSPLHVPVRSALGIESAGALVVLLGVPVVALLAARRLPAVGWAIAFVVVALLPVSNLVVPTGVVVAERTLLLASIGAVLLVAALVAEGDRILGPEGRAPLAAGVAALVVLGGWRSAVRHPVWRDNATLFERTVEDAPLSYKAHWLWGMTLARGGDNAAGVRELQIAVRLFAGDGLLHRYLGELQRDAGRCAGALPPLRRAVEMLPDDHIGPTMLADCLLRGARFSEASRVAREGLERRATRDLRRLAVVADSVLAARDSVPAGGAIVPDVTPATAMRPLAARRSRDQ